MITYDPFWKTLKNSKESTYTLSRNHNIPNGTLNRLRKNLAIRTDTINQLCLILHCPVSDILLFEPTEEELTR